VPSGTFSEYWFRTSGLYDLNRDGVEQYALPGEDEPKHAQMRVMEWFVDGQNCDATKSAVGRKVEDVAAVCEQLDTLAEQLESGVDEDVREDLREEIIAGTYTQGTLKSAIANANKDAKDRAVFGTGALDGLATLEDDSVDCVVTDPPYGEGFESVRPTNNPVFDDEPEDTFALLDRVFNDLQRVCKANAHLYVFFSMSHYEEITSLAGEYFEVEDTPLIWAKNNHAPNAPGNGGFKKNYAQKYEPILHLRMPKGDGRALNGGVSPNLLEHSLPDTADRRHDTQKPRSLLRELIQNSTGKHEKVCDPFAGSGSTLLAAAACGRHYAGFELDGDYEPGFRRELKQINGGGR
jgi:DNA modification methylase